ncbi:MAG TPA: hypothetical protein PKN96_04820 [Flavobacterium sp.]|nr:hypothetical protein [Flavobacterium sp.]HNP32592.1 hypothetical protein [Flavobacterium sp.]
MKSVKTNTHYAETKSDQMTMVFLKVILASGIIIIGCELYVLLKL